MNKYKSNFCARTITSKIDGLGRKCSLQCSNFIFYNTYYKSPLMNFEIKLF